MKTSLINCCLLPIFCALLVIPFRAESSGEDLLLSFGDEDFVSIATGQKQSLADAPAVATVITAEQIEALGAANLDEVLATVPGLHVSLSSLWFSPVYSMRGIHTDKNPQVLMLVNGVPLTQALFGDRGPRSTLPVSSIARVEVIRGPGSAVYGADAFAGVINVITKTAEEIGGTELGIRLGSFASKQLWVTSGNQWGELDVVFNLDWFTTDGDSGRVIDSDSQSIFDAANSQSILGAFIGTSVSSAPGEASTDAKRVDLRFEIGWRNWNFSFWNWRQQSGTGPGIALALDSKGYGEVDDYLIDLSYSNEDIAKHWELAGKLSYMDINHESQQNLFPPGAILPLGEDGNINTGSGFRGFAEFTDGFIGNLELYEKQVRLDVSSFYSGFRSHTLRFAGGSVYSEFQGVEEKNYGAGVLEPFLGFPFVPGPEQIDGTLTDVTDTEYVFMPDSDRTNYYGSVQDEWRFAHDWQLTLGVRYDYFSDFGSTVNPRAALIWNARHDLTTKFLYGRAFRAPSFAELFIANNPVTLGNPDLDPETINTFEIAFDYKPTLDLRTGLNLFYYELDDLIQFQPDVDESGNRTGTRTAQNTSGQDGTGFELEAEWLATKRLQVSGHVAYQHSVSKETKEPVALAPALQLYGALRWEFLPDWELSPRVKWVGGRKRDPNDVRDDIADYTVASLVLRRVNISNHLDISFVVDNLFDEELFEPSPTEVDAPETSLVPNDFPLSGRAFYLSAVYQFNY